MSNVDSMDVDADNMDTAEEVADGAQGGEEANRMFTLFCPKKSSTVNLELHLNRTTLARRNQKRC